MLTPRGIAAGTQRLWLLPPQLRHHSTHPTTNEHKCDSSCTHVQKPNTSASVIGAHKRAAHKRNVVSCEAIAARPFPEVPSGKRGGLKLILVVMSATSRQSSVSVRVVCRVRPQNEIELKRGGLLCVSTPTPTSLSVAELSGETSSFSFDRVFGMASTQAEVFGFLGGTLEDVFAGYNATIFAYGQTSSGKTHTMQGPSIGDTALKGVIPRVMDGIFAAVGAAPDSIEFTVTVSFVEIYLERIRDLLEPASSNLQVRACRYAFAYAVTCTSEYAARLQIRASAARGVFIDGVAEEAVASPAEMMDACAARRSHTHVAFPLLPPIRHMAFRVGRPCDTCISRMGRPFDTCAPLCVA